MKHLRLPADTQEFEKDLQFVLPCELSCSSTRKKQLDQIRPHAGFRKAHSWMSSVVWAAIASCLVAFAFSVPQPAHAQTVTSSISGTITDPSGAALPNARVNVLNQATHHQITTTSNGSGTYVITSIPPGIYTVTVTAPGFHRQVSADTEVDPNIGRTLNFQMSVGTAQTTVTVQANPNTLQTQTATVGQLVTRTEVKSIQLNGRNPILLAQLMPGVTQHSPISNFSFSIGGGPNISGARSQNLLVTYDGTPSLRTRANGYTAGVENVDALSQVQILSTTYPAQFGGTNGGIIVEVPRYGTNQFHGSIYEYLRNSFFDANTWLRNQSPDPETRDHPSPFRFNQFGWVLGGPLYIPGHFNRSRTKLFFFAGQEYVRYRLPSTETATVPTALMRQGNFSELLHPNIFMSPVQLTDPNTGQPYPNNVIPKNQLSPNGLALLNVFPEPNINAPSFNWEATEPNPENQRKDDVSVEYIPSPTQQFRFSFLHYNLFINNPFFANVFPTLQQAQNWGDEDATLHYTWTISPKTINDFVAGVSVTRVHTGFNLANGLWNRTQYGLDYPYLLPAAEKDLPNKIPTIEIQNFTTMDGRPYPSRSGGFVGTFLDNLTRIVGNHTFVFGGLWNYAGENNDDQIDVSTTTPGATNNQNGLFIFTGQHNHEATSGAGVANAALGLFDSYGEIGQRSYSLFRGNSAEFFAQDTWRAKPTLTLQYGVRYSVFQPWFVKWRNQSMFNPKYYDPATAPTVNPVTGVQTGGDPLDGVVIPGSGFPKSAQGHLNPAVLNGQYSHLFRGLSKSYSPIVWSDIQPRLGVTDQVGPTTVVRLGAGRFVQRFAVSDSIQLGGNAPFQPTESVTNGNVDNPGGALVPGASFPIQLSSQAYNFPNPIAWAWSASVEQQIPKLAMLTLSYVGRRGVHLIQLENINELRPGTVQANPHVAPDALRPYKGFASIIQQSGGGSSTYNGMQLELKRRMSRNLLFGVSYTWSKLLDYGSSKGYELPNVFDSSIDYGAADFDIRNVMVIDYVWNIPFADHSSNWLMRNALGDWQWSGIIQAQTGEPLNNIQNGNDYAGVGPGSGAQLWALVKKPNLIKKFGAGDWFNPADFAPPAPGTFAPRGSRNAVYGTGFQSWSTALQKPFHIVRGHENQILMFRAEAFNFTNHPNWDTPNQTPGSSTFGQVTTKGQTYASDRQFQFSLRYSF